MRRDSLRRSRGARVAARASADDGQSERYGESLETHPGSSWILTAPRYGEAGPVADCVEPIEPGSKVSLGFEAPGYVAKRGEVVACLELGSTFRVAIRFEQRLAA